MVLQRAGQYLGGRSGTIIDQHDDGQPGGDIARAGIEIALVGAAAGRDDIAAFQQLVRNQHGLFQQPARIVAQIDHQPAERVSRLGPHRVNGIDEFPRRLFGETRNANVADFILQRPADGFDVNTRANDGDLEGFQLVPLDSQQNLTSRRAAQKQYGRP